MPTCVDLGPLPVPSFHPITCRLGLSLYPFPPWCLWGPQKFNLVYTASASRGGLGGPHNLPLSFKTSAQEHVLSRFHNFHTRRVQWS